MKNDRLLNALGQIDERYIAEARPHPDKRTAFFRKPAVLAAALILCIGLSVTALASTGTLQGFFKDILGRNGAVVGTSYEQASDEIALKIIEAADSLAVEITMLYPNQAPYREFETLSLGAYEIVDMNDTTIASGSATEAAPVADGKASIHLPFADAPEGNYRLIVREMVGGKRADQPLVLRGHWECAFTKELPLDHSTLSPQAQ